MMKQAGFVFMMIKLYESIKGGDVNNLINKKFLIISNHSASPNLPDGFCLAGLKCFAFFEL